ncbi:DUF4926 domain-containing protein [Conexibacter stalactiti]|uniref:DUF4926 domain-containing protein n=1 Tax=Conexibacter stalactiti TaxID=1940611 RepID=A0ABU4HP61_9ACTN|nr:DUF4926 domain-containing protein [Conexibacter stalactiti]MDW5595098.1 DUF4926 domain-containing protein [Conexibacter stalactiti]MEC5035740.1 DUF4926 domain-containing protein [Conexibacter stalactiti]
MTRTVVAEHNVVTLRVPIGTWPAGTVGTVIRAYGSTGLVEITDPDGKTIDTIQVPADRLDAKRA